jgi:60 kDa SS-A/Ro ribonucleoprotein
MAMQLLRTEPNSTIVGYGSRVSELPISANEPLTSVIEKTSALNFGSTNPSLAIDYMRTNGNNFDAMISITDNEVNHGTHPSQAIKKYRDGSGREGHMVVVGMTATRFSMADPLDSKSLDVVGFSSDAPRIITDFVGGRI